MSIYVRYILRQLLVGTLLVTLGLTLIIWLTQSLRFIEMTVNKGASFGLFLKLSMLLMPNFLTYIMPVALFTVVLFTYNKLIDDRELLVMRAAGISHIALARPAILLALINFVLGIIVNIWIIPTTVREFHKVQWLLKSNATGVMLQEGQFNQVGNGLTVYIRSRSADGELIGIVLHDRRNAGRTMTVIAERGAFIKTADGMPKILLFNGTREQVSAHSKRLSLLYFDNYAMELTDNSAAEGDRSRDARERSVTELLSVREDQVGSVQFRQFRVEAHQRLSSPLYHFAFALLASASLLCGWFNRRGQGDRLILAIGLMVAIQAMALGVSNLATRKLVFAPLIYLLPLVPTTLAGWALLFPSVAARGTEKPPLPPFPKGGDSGIQIMGIKIPPLKKGASLCSPPLKKGGRGDFLSALLILIMLVISGPAVMADDAGLPRGRGPVVKHNDSPAVMSADETEFDSDLNLVVARGHVEIFQTDRVLKADTLTYLIKQDVIIASGHVSLTEINGEVSFADYMELTGDMKEGAVKSLGVLQIDDSRLSAASARRFSGDRHIMNKAVYTACLPCSEPDAAPLWVVKAELVTHDEVSHRMEYQDAWLDFMGVPIAYVPYLSHPGPEVKRDSGLLSPSFISNKVLGNAVRVPYFIVLDPNEDMTLAPVYSNNDDLGLSGVYRWRSYYGMMKAAASVADMPAPNYTGRQTTGWNLKSKGIFDLDDEWRFTYVAERASDKNYLDTFGYRNVDPYLKIQPTLEYFSGRNYADINGYSFQRMTTENSVINNNFSSIYKEPVIFPAANYSFVGSQNNSGGYFTSDLHSAIISRTEGANTRQFNSFTAYHQPYMTENGQILRFSTGFRGDGYDVSSFSSPNASGERSGRALPVASVDWRYPFSNIGDHSSQTITPIVMLAASPNGANPVSIPNQDSLDFELDDRNVFSATPTSGFDRVVTGPRAAYGAQYSVVNRGRESAEIMLAQSYYARTPDGLPANTGLDHNFSDIVGRVGVSPSSNVVFQYRFRFDEHKEEFARHEVTTSVGPRMLNLQTSYVYYEEVPVYAFSTREQITATLTTQWNKTWSTQIYSVHNLGSVSSNLDSGLRMLYDDECFTLVGDFGRRDTTSRVFAAGNYLTFQIVFKTLGQMPLNFF